MKGLKGVEYEVAHVLVHVGVEHAPVEVVDGAAAVHDLADEVAQARPRYLVVAVLDRLAQIGVEYLHADAEVGLVEVVGDIPADLVVLAALLHHGVEEGEHEDERRKGLVRARLLAERGRADLVEGVLQVELEAIGRLGDDLERTLQDADGKGGRRLRGQPEAKVRMRLGQLLQVLLELLEPLDEQVAVLQHEPEAAAHRLLQVADGDLLLALAHRQQLHLGRAEVGALGELEQVGGRIRARTEYEDNGRHGRALVPDRLEADDGRRHELLAHHVRYVLRHGQVDAIDAEAAEEHELLELVERVRVAVRHLARLGRVQVEERAPRALIALNGVEQRAERLREVARQPHAVLPALVGQPGVRLLALALLERDVALDEEVELLLGDVASVLLQLDGDLEGEEELVLLEDAAAAVVVDVHGERVHDVDEALLQVGVRVGLAQRVLEHVQVAGERVLVHAVHGAHLG